METLNHPKPETAHILFLDAVGYSTLPLNRQTSVFRGLQDFVNDSPTVAEAAARDEIIRISPSLSSVRGIILLSQAVSAAEK